MGKMKIQIHEIIETEFRYYRQAIFPEVVLIYEDALKNYDLELIDKCLRELRNNGNRFMPLVVDIVKHLRKNENKKNETPAWLERLTVIELFWRMNGIIPFEELVRNNEHRLAEVNLTEQEIKKIIEQKLTEEKNEQARKSEFNNFRARAFNRNENQADATGARKISSALEKYCGGAVRQGGSQERVLLRPENQGNPVEGGLNARG
jgi:hypothetical protein